jgi:hypothetical protein
MALAVACDKDLPGLSHPAGKQPARFLGWRNSHAKPRNMQDAPRYQPVSPLSYPRRFGNQVAIAGNAMMISRSMMLIAM